MPTGIPMTAPLYFADAAAFRRWLETHAATETELLVGFRKVGSGQPSMTWPESVDEALCFGWIDGRRKRVDDTAYSIRFTPRKANSIWSSVNIAKMAQLRAAGRMTPAGEQAFALRSEAKSGIYSHEQARAAELEAEETAVFMADPAAWAYFGTLPPGYRKQVLHWITTAKKAETRAGRLARLVQACAAGKRLA